jgi:hypothetical protein
VKLMAWMKHVQIAYAGSKFQYTVNRYANQWKDIPINRNLFFSETNSYWTNAEENLKSLPGRFC